MGASRRAFGGEGLIRRGVAAMNSLKKWSRFLSPVTVTRVTKRTSVKPPLPNRSEEFGLHPDGAVVGEP